MMSPERQKVNPFFLGGEVISAFPEYEAIRARVPLEVLRDTIQPFPTFSEIYIAALKALHREILRARVN